MSFGSPYVRTRGGSSIAVTTWLNVIAVVSAYGCEPACVAGAPSALLVIELAKLSTPKVSLAQAGPASANAITIASEPSAAPRQSRADSNKRSSCARRLLCPLAVSLPAPALRSVPRFFLDRFLQAFSAFASFCARVSGLGLATGAWRRGSSTPANVVLEGASNTGRGVNRPETAFARATRWGSGFWAAMPPSTRASYRSSFSSWS